MMSCMFTHWMFKIYWCLISLQEIVHDEIESETDDVTVTYSYPVSVNFYYKFAPQNLQLIFYCRWLITVTKSIIIMIK